MKKWYIILLYLPQAQSMQKASALPLENRLRTSSAGIPPEVTRLRTSSITSSTGVPVVRRLELSGGGSPRGSSPRCASPKEAPKNLSQEEQALWAAVRKKDFDNAQKLLEENKRIRINEADSLGMTLLMVAIKNADPDMVILVLNHDAITDNEDLAGMSVLMHAMNLKDTALALEIAQYLYIVDRDITLRATQKGTTPVAYMLDTENEAFADFLLVRGAKQQLTIQMLAKCHNPTLFKKLAPLLQQHPEKETAIAPSTTSPATRRVELLRKATNSKPSDQECLTLSARNSQDLNQAIAEQKVDEALQLLEDSNQNFRIDRPDGQGTTKLMAAIQAMQPDIVIGLLNSYASTNSEDLNGISVFMHAMNLKNTAIALKIASYLHQADPEITTRATRNCKTPLAHTFETSNEAFIDFLLEHGARKQLTMHMAAGCLHHELGLKFAKPYIKNNQISGPDTMGRTVLMIACRAGNIELVRLLLQAKQDPNLQDTSGNSALFYASWCQNTKHALAVIELLLKKNANKTLKNQMRSTAADATPNADLKKLLQP